MLWYTTLKSSPARTALHNSSSRSAFFYTGPNSTTHTQSRYKDFEGIDEKSSSICGSSCLRPRSRGWLHVLASPATEPIKRGRGRPAKPPSVDENTSPVISKRKQASYRSSLGLRPGFPGTVNRTRDAVGGEVSPPELVPIVIDPWKQSSRKSLGSGSSPGRGARRKQKEQQQRNHIEQRHNLRWRMQQCKRCAQLHALLLEVQHELLPTDVAFAWHLAARRSFFQVAAPHQPASIVEALHLVLTQLAQDAIAAMGPVGLSTTAWACAISQLPCRPLVGAICKRAEERLYMFRPRELCALLWASGVVAPADNRLLRGCSRLLEQGMSLDLFTPHDLSVLVWCCGKVDYHPVALLEAATQQCVSTAASFDAASAARLVHGYALLQYRPPGLVAPLAARCVCIMHTFSPQDLSLLNSSLGMLLLDPDQNFVQASAGRGVDLLHSASPKQLTHLVWGFARMGHVRVLRSFLPRLCTRVLASVGEYGGELLGPLLWALAKLQYTPRAAVMEGVLAHLTKEMSHQTPSTLATVMWSVGTMEARAPGAVTSGVHFRTFLDRALRQLSAGGRQPRAEDAPSVLIGLASIQVRPPEPLLGGLIQSSIRASESLPGDALARIAWAAAVLEIRDSRLMGAIVSAAAGQHLLPQSIAQLAWSLASLNCAAEELLLSMARSLAALAPPPHGDDTIPAFDKARILWAYAHLGVLHPPMMGRLLGGLKGQELVRMGPTGVAAAVWACAKLGYDRGPLLELVGEYVSEQIQDFSEQQLLQLGWSLAKLGCQDQLLLDAISRQYELVVAERPASTQASYEVHLQPQPPP